MVLYWVPMKGAFLHALIRYRAMQPLNLSGHREAVDADSTVPLCICRNPLRQSIVLRRIRDLLLMEKAPNLGVFLFAEPNIV